MKPNQTSFKKGCVSYTKGTKGMCKPNSGSFKKGQFSLEKHPFWKGGKSFEPYGIDFNNQLKETIRRRDNYMCQECNHTQEQLRYKLHVHHIDYNKNNNNPKNLISLCKSCHSQANFDRSDWENYFNKILNNVEV